MQLITAVLYLQHSQAIRALHYRIIFNVTGEGGGILHFLELHPDRLREKRLYFSMKLHDNFLSRS